VCQTDRQREHHTHTHTTPYTHNPVCVLRAYKQNKHHNLDRSSGTHKCVYISSKSTVSSRSVCSNNSVHFPHNTSLSCACDVCVCVCANAISLRICESVTHRPPMCDAIIVHVCGTTALPNCVCACMRNWANMRRKLPPPVPNWRGCE